jgi:hypothetical protein
MFLVSIKAGEAQFSLRLAPDADARGAEAMARFVVAGGKIDKRPSFLAPSFFPAKNS